MPKRTRTAKKIPALRSKLEERTKEQLDKHGITYDYEGYTIPFRTPVRGGICEDCAGRSVHQQRRYLPDFTIRPSGIVVEVKGYLPSPQRSKILGIRKWNPDLDFRMVFGSDNKISKGSSTRYSDWCEQNGIPYCIRIIPDNWLEDFRKGRTDRG